MPNLGTKLKKLREEQNITQAKLAKRLGISQLSYSNWETNKSIPCKENLMKIYKYYNIKLKDLMNDQEIANEVKTDTNIKEKIIKNKSIVSKIIDNKPIKEEVAKNKAAKKEVVKNRTINKKDIKELPITEYNSIKTQPTSKMLEQLLRTHEQISKNQEQILKLMEVQQEQNSKFIEIQQEQNSKLLESHFKLFDMIK